LLIREAFDVLGLRPGAPASEIKEAYRDLVKVWHPDRFGSDPRLRQRAEAKLKEINEAYRMVQADPGMARPENADTFSSRSETAQRYAPKTPIRRRSGRKATNRAPGIGWISAGLGILAILLAGYFVVDRGMLRGAEPSPTVVEQPSMAGTAVEPGPERIAGSADSTAGEIRPRSAGRPKDSGGTVFQVRSLSAAETERLETACSRLKELRGEVAYRSCVKAQLDWMANPTGKPDLDGLNEAERESIESVCSGAKRHREMEGYNRCENEQVASLAAEPARPDLSKLNGMDRDAVQLACKSVKEREGPAAYERCLERTMRVLAQAR
jgi:hypothetical protein